MNLKRKRKGFTLVELIIVIAVIGVLAAILIPVFANVVEKANAKSALSDARNAVSSYVTDATDKLASGIHMPENITIIVEKASKYYVFGYNMNNGGVIMVSTGNPYPASDTVDLVDNYSWNGLQTGDYDPDVPEATLTSYSIATHGGFYLVPYTNTNPDNPAVRGIALRTAGTYRLLNREMDAEVDAGTEIYHGCIVGRNYVGADESAPAADNAGNQTPTPTPNHTVTFNFTGLTSGDEENVVLKKGSEVLTNPASIPDGTYVNELSAEYPHNEDTDDYWYTVGTATADSPVIHGDITVTFNFTRVNVYTLNFVMGSGETFVPASGASATMRLRAGDDIASIVRDSSATTETAGQTFRYWTEQGSSENFAPGTGALTMPARSVTLVPYFSLQNISVTYKSGDHATGDDYDDSVTYGTHAMPSFDTIATTAGWNKDANYDFYRWYDGSNEYQAGANYTFTSTTTLTARYTELNYTVTINQPAGVTAVTGGGTYNMSVNSVNFTVTLNSNYYLTGYSVSGLTGTTTLPADATSIDTTAATAGNTIAITPNVAAKTVNVTFVSDPTSVATLPANITSYEIKDGDITLTAPTGVAAHYTFTSYTASGTNITASITNGNTKLHLENPTANTSSVTVTAHFTAEQTYTVTYDKNTTDTVSGMPANDTGVYAGSHTLSSATPTRTGYDFIGWGETSGATSTVSSITVSGNTTVYAVWQIKTYTVTFYANGTQYSTAQVNHGSTATAPTAPTKTGGYTFKHWSLENNGADATTGAEYNFATLITGNTSLYAVWNAPAAPTSELVLTLRLVDVTGYAKPALGNNQNLQDDVLGPRYASHGVASIEFYQDDIDRFDEELDTFVKKRGYQVWGHEFTTVFPNYPYLGNDTIAYSFVDYQDWNIVCEANEDYDITFGSSGPIYYYPIIRATSTLGISDDSSFYNAAPTEIRTQAELLSIGSTKNKMSKSYILMNDITLSFGSGETWVPLGTGLNNGNDYAFTGDLDGNGKTIYGLESLYNNPIVDPVTGTANPD